MNAAAAREQPADPGEVLWTWHYPDAGGPPVRSWRPHAVLRKTARHVFVADPRDGRRTFRLDRGKLEANGRYWSHAAGRPGRTFAGGPGGRRATGGA